MEKWLCDVETFPNFFCVGLKKFAEKERKYFEISEYRDDREELRNFFFNYKDFLITFNGIDYDVPMILYAIKNKHVTNQQLKDFSDHIINNEYWRYEYNMKIYSKQYWWKDLDLFLYWSLKTRQERKISLKGLGISMKYPVVQELPYDPSTYLTPEQIKEVREYNEIHDLGILELLTAKKEEEIRLRVYLYNTYKLKCLSEDAIKIATMFLLKDYCSITKSDPNVVYNLRFQQEDIPDLSDVNPQFKTKELIDIFEHTKRTGELKANFMLFNLPLSMGSGGIHSVNKYEIYSASKDVYLITSDARSLYPTLIENWKLLRFHEVLERYTKTKVERFEAKAAKEVIKDAFFKLILNGVSGLLDLEYSWLNYPENALKMRFIGQFLIAKLCEEVSLHKFTVVSANTDGVEVLVPKHRLEEYFDIVKSIEHIFNVEFEHEYYKKIYYQSVNDYIAVYDNDKKEPKLKGSFLINPPIEYSSDFLVVPKSLVEHVIKGVSPTYFIKQHKDILDFCASQKVGKNYEIIYDGEKQQRLNRYYASMSGAFLYKLKKETGRKTHMLKSSGVKIYNNHNPEIFPKDINYNFYIQQVNNILNQFYNKQQTLF